MIRLAVIRDASDIAELCDQLGYRVTDEQVAHRLNRLVNDEDNAVYVFENPHGQVLGWVHVFGKHLIESEYAEIGGLVVDKNCRRQGIGQKLMRQCEEWSTNNGYREIRLRSGGHRHEAHVFYQRIGYDNTKWQQVFNRIL